MSEPIQDTNNTSPSALAPATVSTSSNSSRQSRAPPCTKCQRVYIRGKAEGQYDRFRDDQNAGREAGYLEGVRPVLSLPLRAWNWTPNVYFSMC